MTSKYPNGSGLASGSPIAAWQLQFSGRGPHDPTTGQACASNVETVFAPNNDAFNEFFQNFPHWLDSNGEVVLDSIPQDSLDMIILHHIYSNNTNGLGAKLYVEIENPVCSEQQIIRGSNNPYKMMDGNNFIFAENAQGNVAALSVLTNRFSIIESPDLATTDGAIYIINNVLGPF
ncbi:MAG: fasciclin domain-containing protein [Chitinophagales bacterium]